MTDNPYEEPKAESSGPQHRRRHAILAVAILQLIAVVLTLCFLIWSLMPLVLG
jgi:hypothetical protein